MAGATLARLRVPGAQKPCGAPATFPPRARARSRNATLRWAGQSIATLGYEGSPSAIPEPGSCLGLAGLLSSGLLLRQRKRVQRG